MYVMQHQQKNNNTNLSHLLNLLLTSTNIIVRHIWLFLHSHHGYTWINFWRQRNLNLIFVAINSSSTTK